MINRNFNIYYLTFDIYYLKYRNTLIAWFQITDCRLPNEDFRNTKLKTLSSIIIIRTFSL